MPFRANSFFAQVKGALLMRRALRGIVPDEILMRRRKAIARAPVVTIQQEWTYLESLTEEMV
jgi:hypothetical protein